jgi:hypothetical protein
MIKYDKGFQMDERGEFGAISACACFEFYLTY